MAETENPASRGSSRNSHGLADGVQKVSSRAAAIAVASEDHASSTPDRSKRALSQSGNEEMGFDGRDGPSVGHTTGAVGSLNAMESKATEQSP